MEIITATESVASNLEYHNKTADPNTCVKTYVIFLTKIET